MSPAQACSRVVRRIGLPSVFAAFVIFGVPGASNGGWCLLGMEFRTPVGPSYGYACPFCGSVQSTLAQDIKGSDVAIVAKLVALPEARRKPRTAN